MKFEPGRFLSLAAWMMLAVVATTSVHAAPAFLAAGAAVSGTGAVSPAWPAHAVDDVALLIVESAGGEPVTLSTPAGFVEVANSPQATGVGTAGTRITVFWARATSAAMPAPTVADPGDHVYARIFTYGGVIAAGDPWDVTGGGVRDNTITVTGLTTGVANTRIVQAVTRETDSAAALFSGPANGNLTGITERVDAGGTSGDGGGFAVWDGVKATAGAIGDSTVTVATASINAFLTIALRPQGVAAPTFQAAGAGISGTGNVSPAWPAHAVNDVALLFVESRGTEAATLSTPAGFVEVTGSPQVATGGGNGTRLTVFWARATSTTMAAPTVLDPGNHAYARIVTYRGVVTAGNPWDATAGGIRDTVDLSGITTTVADTLVVQAATRDNDSAAAAFSAQTNASLGAITEQSDAGTTQGNGGGFAVWDGVKATAGATGVTTAQVNVGSVNAYLSIALRKPPFPVVVSIDRASADPTTTGTVVSWTVTFSASVTGVDATDFALVMGGGASGAAITTVIGGGTTWTVNANTGTGTGTLGLNLVDDDTIVNASLTPLGGSGAGNGNFAGQVYSIIFTPGNYVFTSGSCLDGVAFGGPGQCALVAWSPQLAGQNLTGVYITAVDGSNVPTRVHPAQDRTRDMDFGLSCQNPVANAGRQAGFAGQTLPLCEANGATPTTWSPAVTVTFLAGVPSSSASYTFNYADVGLVNLWMRNNATPAETGNSGVFVVKPGGFVLSAIQQTAAPNLPNPGAANAGGAKFVKAGEAFSVTVKATTVDGVTAVPNYGQEISPESVKLGVNLVAPAAGASPALLNETAFGAFSGGIATGTGFAWNEVGIITLTPSVGDGDYIGAGDTTGAVTGNVGRFYPYQYDISGPSLTPATGTISYLDQPFGAAFTLTAKSATGTPTTNYTTAGGFAKLDPTNPALWPSTTLGSTGFALGARNGATDLSTRFALNGTPTGTWSSGEVMVSAQVTLARPTTTTPDATWGPYDSLDIGVAPQDSDGVTLAVAALDMDANGDSTNERKKLGQTKARFGRLRLLNAYGSELLPMRVEYRAEYWDGSRWTTNALDSSTALVVGNVAKRAALPVPAISVLSNGVGFITFAPTAVGAYDIALNLGSTVNDASCNAVALPASSAANMPWLRGSWAPPASCNGTAAWAQDPNVRVKFGSPKAPYIYLRERY